MKSAKIPSDICLKIKQGMALLLTSIMLLSCSSCSNTEAIAYLNKTMFLSSGEHDSVIQKFYHENAVCLTNMDSTRTMYLYSSPIYYQDSVQAQHTFIKNTLVQDRENGGTFTNPSNDIQSQFPSTWSVEAPILIKKSYSKMAVYPITGMSRPCQKKTFTNVYGLDEEGLLYKQAFGNNDVYIAPDDFGINMEIVLQGEATSSIAFCIEMENVEADTTCPDYVLFRDVKEQEVKGVLYKPLVMEKGGNLIDSLSNDAYTFHITKTESNVFTIKIDLQKTFLEKATYPIKINGSLHMYKSKQPDSAIYSNSAQGYYLNDKVLLGNSPDKGEGQLLVRFEALDLIDLQAEEIISAEYMLSEISKGESTASIAMYPVLSEWCSLNTRWASKPVYDTQNAYRVSVTKSGDYSFDITEPLKKWIENRGKETEYIIRHGFVLVNETPENPKLFATGDNGMFTSCLKIKLRKA